jgi:hypothetical protein
MSPRASVTGTSPDFNTHCHVPIGAYCQVHNENNPSNTEETRMSGAVALNLTGKLQGSYRFMSLATGKCLSQRRWTKLPITAAIIARVHELAFAEQTYDLKTSNFHFAWGPNDPLVEDIDKELQEHALTAAPPHILEGAVQNDEPQNEEIEQEEQEPYNIHHQDTENEEQTNNAVHNHEEENEDDKEDTKEDDGGTGVPIQDQEGGHEAPDQEQGARDAHDQDQGAHDAHDQEQEALEEHDQDTVETINNKETEEEAPRHNLQGKHINYDHWFINQFLQTTRVVPKAPKKNLLKDLHNHVILK